MITCQKCGHTCQYTSKLCPVCGEPYELSKQQIEEKLNEIKDALSSHEYEIAVEGYRILADMGHVPSMREYANILERGELVNRNLDLAMSYFLSAAENDDIFSAYKYSRLAERTSEHAANFWLKYSAVFGCTEAYLPLADLLSKEDDDRNANYFYFLAANTDEPDAIVTLAKRYYNGMGVKKSLPYAKWYMDKLNLPPIHAIKMAYKLRSEKAEEPEAPKLYDYTKVLKRLAIQASELKLARPYFRLCSLLSEKGDMQAVFNLALLYLDGTGTAQNTEVAIELLEKAAAHGIAEAYRQLADIYLCGTLVKKNPETALNYYKLAAKAGLSNAYETMGDIYCEGKLVERNIPEAIKLYELSAKEGYTSAKSKLTTLKNKREELFNKGKELEKDNPKEAFQNYLTSSLMGYVPAYNGMAKCYIEGMGVKKKTRNAFECYKHGAGELNTESIYGLALCYTYGIGTRFDFESAEYWLIKSSLKGIDEAKEELKRIYERKARHMVGALYSKSIRLIYLKKFNDAAKYLKVCAEMKHAKGTYVLGCLNEFNLFDGADRKIAFSLYNQAFGLNFKDPRAVFKLKILKMAKDY